MFTNAHYYKSDAKPQSIYLNGLTVSYAFPHNKF